MISSFLTPGLIVEVIVMLLLAVTACYCFTLNKKLKVLKDSQGEVRQTIAALNQATIRAENAISGLKSMTDDVDDRLSENMEKAKVLSDHFGALSRASERSSKNVTSFRKAS